MILISPFPTAEYICTTPLDLYDHSDCRTLATQSAQGRHFRLTSQRTETAIQVQQCEDEYRAWLPLDRLSDLLPAKTPYEAIAVSRGQIEARLDAVIAYTLRAKDKPNTYLWGGNIGPNYDCSGLMQAAFSSVGIWLPRDSFQQEAFCQPVAISDLVAGDLIFFGQERVDHVALYLGNDHYIHSSGKSQGRNGIGIDRLTADSGNPISQAYFEKWRSCGRVMHSVS